MLRDAAVPTGGHRAVTAARDVEGLSIQAHRWTPTGLRDLAGRLQPATDLPAERLLAAWSDTIDLWLDRRSPVRRRLEAPLSRLCRLSPEGFRAGLETILGGVRRPIAARLFGAERGSADGLVVVILASNLPGLAVQPLLPALACRRPVLLKSPSSEPLFAPALVRELGRREPSLRRSIAAVTWAGGDRSLEEGVLGEASTVLAYGGGDAIDDLARRLGRRLVAYGPKISLAAVGADVEPHRVAAGLARDIALFDQRGCLSIQAVYTEGDADGLAGALATALEGRARAWPPGELALPDLAAVRQLRDEAALRGLTVPPLPLEAGTVIVEPRPDLRLSPGLRTVRVHPLPTLAGLPGLLAPWSGRLQGIALAGDSTDDLVPQLTALGISRCAPPGELQSPDATWHNGGVSPLGILSGSGC